MEDFDPNAPGTKGSLFGLPYSTEEAAIVVIPVPWEATVSYGNGTSNGTDGIIEASSQIDLNHPLISDVWKLKIALGEIPDVALVRHHEIKELALEHIADLEIGGEGLANLALINQVSEELNRQIYENASDLIGKGKFPVVLGGDHSTPLGLMKAVIEKYPDVGILQVDAHADLRPAYEGFQYSHASIMHNILDQTKLKNLMQIGVRDLSEEEAAIIKSDPRIATYFDHVIKARIFNGESWDSICCQIVDELPDEIYISFDIDGLSPENCPNTGTPVPGGLSYDMALHLMNRLITSGKKVVGFDLVEVVPGDNRIDQIIGSRILFNLAATLGATNHLVPQG